MLTRKERQVEKLYDELHSMKLFSEEQKQMIDQLNEELECEARSRRKCAELEDEVRKSKIADFFHKRGLHLQFLDVYCR